MKKCCGPLHKGVAVNITSFAKNQKTCRGCQSIYNKKRYALKFNQIRAYAKEWRKANKERLKSYRKAWAAKNPNYAPPNRAMPMSRLVITLRARLYGLLGKSLKKQEIEDYIGCSIPHFYKWLESKFTPGMGWSNYGKGGRVWVIGYINGDFDKSDPDAIKKAMHYTNTRPVWYKDSKKKAKEPLTLLPLAA